MLRLSILAAAILLLGGPVCADVPAPEHPISWIMFNADGKAEIRAIVPVGQSCPLAHNGTVDIALAPASTADAAFPVILCRADLPPDATTIRIGATNLKAPKPTVNRIVVLGDSGCRLKAGSDPQACNDPKAWPFATLATHAAGEAPDLIIHVGDYHYREMACPPGNVGCAGSPWGYDWPAWNADFFAPAAPLLSAAPWVMLRGNHEDCRRAGHGWTLLLSPDAMPASAPCLAAHHPYRIDIGGLALVVIDDNDAPNQTINPTVAQRMTQDLKNTIPVGQPWWLLTHHPAHGVVKVKGADEAGDNPTLSQAIAANPAADLLISGHIHALQVENYQDGHPPQLVVGTGGDALEKHGFPDLGGVVSGGWTIRAGFSDIDFGYAVMERDGEDWRITGHRPDGAPAKYCRLHRGQITCTAE